MIYGQTIEEAGQYALNMIKELVDSDQIYMMSYLRNEFSMITSFDKDGGFVAESEQASAVNMLCSLVIQSNQAIIISNLQMEVQAEVEASFIHLMSQYGISSLIVVPIYTKDEIYGVICVISRSPVQYGSKDVRLLEGMAAIIGYVVELKGALMKDALTGLYNRNYIEYCSQRWIVQDSKPFISLMYIDIDNFKAINDRYGHMTGDAVLRSLAERFKKIIGSEEVIIRMGGDEFIVIIESSEKEAKERMLQIAQSLLEQMIEPIVTAQAAITASLSMGISSGSLEHTSIHELILQADSAMYGVKHNGKGAYKLSHVR